MTRLAWLTGGGALAVPLIAGAMSAGDAQQPGRPARPPVTQPADPHAGHGTPKGWKFTLPGGNPSKGREVFAKLECYACHEVKGEKFPATTERDKAGPELSQMGPLHDAEYFAEAVINPSAVVEKAKGYQGPDGSSKMPSFNDSMTVQELIDLVAYLGGLEAAAGANGGHRGH